MASKVLKTHSTLIPEQLPKPLQLFHGITLDGQIKIPSLSGSSAQKHDKRGERREENSWEHIAAKFFFPASAFVFSGRSGGRGGQTPFSLKAFCLVNTTFPFSVLRPLLEFSEASTNSPAYTHFQYTSKQTLCTYTELHVDFGAIRS